MEETIVFTILFVCTGNTCRSPMAWAIAEGILSQKDAAKKVRIISAGTSVIPDSKAADFAIEVMEERGLDLKKHVARQLTPELIDEADLILTMTGNHKHHILAVAPYVQEKVFTLKEYANSSAYQDIYDPIGQPTSAYKECANELEFHIRAILEKNINDLIISRN